MERKWHSRKLNDAGMSLVEVVISMAILSVVILGVLHSFVYSANYNARSRMRQQTTAAAQTVMENFKAYSVRDIYDGCMAGTFTINGSSMEVTSGSSYDDGNMTFTISGMQYQNETYDVEVVLEEHASQAAFVETLNYEDPTQEHSAVFVGYAGMDVDALTAIMDLVAQEWTDKENAALAGDATSDPDATPVPTTVSHSSNEVDRNKIKITKREIKIDISKSDDTGNYVATVSCIYYYKVNGHPYITDIYGTQGTFDMPEDQYVADLSNLSCIIEDGKIFDSSTELKTLTLYYYPAYSYVSGAGDPNTQVKIDKDYIYIDNSTGKSINCYIYKQKNTEFSNSRLSTLEEMYEVYLVLNKVCVYDDNLNTLFGNELDNDIVESKIHVESVNGDEKRYHGIGYAAVNTNYPTNADYSPAIPTSESTKDTVDGQRMMYNVKIEIYKSDPEVSWDSKIRLNTLSGTIVE